MLDADDVRRIALSFPETVEKQRWGHPTFDVAGRMFAMDGLKPGNGDWGSGTPSSGPSGVKAPLPDDIAAYVARKQAQADALEARLAQIEARIAELEAR